jgi:excitatory amino acid transporter, putative
VLSVCNLLKQGIAAIFGPSSEETVSHIQSTCDVLNVPHLEARLDYRYSSPNHSINLYPDASIIGQAIRDLVKTKNWKTFGIIYQENDG